MMLRYAVLPLYGRFRGGGVLCAKINAKENIMLMIPHWQRDTDHLKAALFHRIHQSHGMRLSWKKPPVFQILPFVTRTFTFCVQQTKTCIQLDYYLWLLQHVCYLQVLTEIKDLAPLNEITWVFTWNFFVAIDWIVNSDYSTYTSAGYIYITFVT